LIISSEKYIPVFKDLLGDGRDLGIKITYAIQEEPRGIAESFIIGEKFIGKDSVCLILGDNIFFGHNLTEILQDAAQLKWGGLIFGYYVRDPQRYGVIELNKDGEVVSIQSAGCIYSTTMLLKQRRKCGHQAGESWKLRQSLMNTLRPVN
jgi:glucose-1-phosphate thymidylyltransferase